MKDKSLVWMVVVAGASLAAGCPAAPGSSDAALADAGLVSDAYAEDASSTDAAADAAAMDATALDDAAAGDAGTDGGAAVPDAASDSAMYDGGTDAAIDAGPIDLDGDGIREPYDCDDTNATVGLSGERSCSGACGAGTETCLHGVWSACDAPTDCACFTEGMTRGVTCGLCGTRRQTCTSGTWVDSSDCLMQGVCVPGDTQTQDTGYCVTQTRTCSSTCTWGDYVDDGPRGECRAGFVEVCAPELGLYHRTCAADCTWGPRDPSCV